MYVCIWIRYILLETMISYMWLWIIWLWIHSDTQPMGNKIYFVRNYAFIYVIMNNLTVNSFWYPANGGYLLVFWYPNQWRLFIGILIPKPTGVIHWYSDTQTNGGYSLLVWNPANGGYSLVVWYPTNGGYSLVLWCPVTRI